MSEQELRRHRCCFTGHRPERLGMPEMEVLFGLKEEIRTAITDGFQTFISGMARGVDLWAAEIVLDLREKNPALKLRCVLPYGGQADRWSDSARERYHSILKQADSVDYVSRQYYDGCMIDRNHRLVESAGLLLAVFSGVRRSGTGATVNYARKLGREIIVIDPLTRSVTHEGGGA